MTCFEMYLGAMNVARLRKLKGWSQTDLADIVGVEQPTISRIERGTDAVTLRLARQVAEALDVPLYQIFLDDTSDAELILLKTYRSLSDDRKKGWQDMALAAKVDVQKGDQ